MIFDVYTALRHMAADGKTITLTDNESIRYSHSKYYNRIGWIENRADGMVNEGSIGIDYWVKENEQRMFELYHLAEEVIIVPEEAALLNIPNTTNPDCPTYMVKEGVDKRLPEKEPTMLSNGYPELDRKNPVAAPMKKCPKCRATMFLDTTGNWCCSFVGDQRQGIAGCDYWEERKPAKESPSADWKKGYSMGVHDRGLESEAKLKDEIITKMMDYLRNEKEGQ